MRIDVQASGQYAGLVAGIPHRPAGRDGAIDHDKAELAQRG